MNNEEIEKEHKKFIAKGIIRIIITLVVIAFIVYGGYSYIKNDILNPIKYLTNVNLYLENTINNHLSFKMENNSLKDSRETGEILFKTNSKDLDYFNHLSIDYNIKTSIEKEEIQSNIKLNEDNKSILDGNIYLQKDKIFLDSKDLYDKTILLSKLSNNIFTNLKEDNMNISIDEAKNIFKNYIKYFLQSMEEADVNSSFVDFFKIKHTYEINDNNKDKIKKKYEELLKNDKIINTFIKENNELLNINLQNAKIEIIKSLGTNEIFEIKYNSGDYSFEIVQDSESRNLYHIKDGDNKGTLEIKNDVWTIKLYENEIVRTTINFTNNDDILSIGITDNDIDINFSFKNNIKDTIGLSFSFKSTGEEAISIDLSGIIEKKEIGYNSNMELDMDIHDEKIKILARDKIEYGDNLLESVDISNYSEYDKLNENEQNQIYENLFKKLNGTKLFELLNNEDNYS